jgi:hypothetical protein
MGPSYSGQLQKWADSGPESGATGGSLVESTDGKHFENAG